jgi:TatA/E family protein of Tat protein translocase
VIGDILQPTHLLFVLVVALLVLGPKRLPEVGRSLGKGLRDFRHAMSGDDTHTETIEPPSPPSASTPAHVDTQPSPAATAPAPADAPAPPAETVTAPADAAAVPTHDAAAPSEQREQNVA